MLFSDWLRVIFLSLVWGGSFFFVEILLETVPPLTAVFGRLVVGLIGLCCLLILVGCAFSQVLKQWRPFLFLGLVGNAIPFSLINLAQTQITGSLASIINALTPIITALVAHYLTTDERLSLRKLVGIAAGFAGIIVLFGPAAFAGDNIVWGMSAGLLATFGYAVASVFAKRLNHNPPMLNATGQVFYGALWMFPLVILIDQPWNLPAIPVSGWMAWLGIGFLSTTVGMYIFFKVLKTAGASNVVLVTFLVPVSASGLGFLFLDERLYGHDIIAYFLIVSGLSIIDGRIFSILGNFRLWSHN